MIVKIGGLILNENKELLLFKNKGKDIWTCPGGKIEKGESDVECLRREMIEESQIKVVKAEYLCETDIEIAAGSTDKEIVLKFYLINDYDGDLTINPEDSVEFMDWISRDEFEKFLDGQSTKFEAIGSGITKYAIPKLIEMNLM